MSINDLMANFPPRVRLFSYSPDRVAPEDKLYPPAPIKYGTVAYQRINQLVEAGRIEAAERIVERRGGIESSPQTLQMIEPTLRRLRHKLEWDIELRFIQ